MKTSIIVGTLFLGFALTGCGGGGGSDTTQSKPDTVIPALPEPQRLASYIGTWATPCDNHEFDTATIVRTPGTTDSINVSVKTDYFSAANCTGPVIGTFTESGVFTAKYVGQVNTSVALAPGATPTPVTLEQITASSTQSTQNVTGSGVVKVVKNGQAQWCIDFGGGNSTCIMDNGPQPAQSGLNGALYIQGNDIFLLSPSGNTYSVDEKYTKK